MADFQKWLRSNLDGTSATVLVCGAFDVLDVTGELGNEVQVVHLTGGMLPEAVGRAKLMAYGLWQCGTVYFRQNAESVGLPCIWIAKSLWSKVL